MQGIRYQKHITPHSSEDSPCIAFSFTILLFLIETSKTKTAEKFGKDSDGFHLSFQRDTSIIVFPMVYQTFVEKCLQKYRMLQCPKFGHTTFSRGILCLDLIRLSSYSFFFAALQVYLFKWQHKNTYFLLEKQQISSE